MSRLSSISPRRLIVPLLIAALAGHVLLMTTEAHGGSLAIPHRAMDAKVAGEVAAGPETNASDDDCLAVYAAAAADSRLPLPPNASIAVAPGDHRIDPEPAAYRLPHLQSPEVRRALFQVYRE